MCLDFGKKKKRAYVTKTYPPIRIDAKSSHPNHMNHTMFFLKKGVVQPLVLYWLHPTETEPHEPHLKNSKFSIKKRKSVVQLFGQIVRIEIKRQTSALI
jgi:hypothetical protein